VAVEVFAADEQSDQPVDTLRWIRLAEAVLQEEELAGDAELSVLFVDERSISELNARFLGKDGPTDVLAFPIDEEPVESGRSPDSGGTGPGMPSEPEDMPVLLGDIVICPAVAFRNAPEHAGTYEDELALLVVHGLLHLMGMDHDEDDEAEEMEAKERELLARHHAQVRAEAWPIKRGEGAGPAGEGAGPASEGAEAAGEGAGASGDGSVAAVDGAKGAGDAVSGAIPVGRTTVDGHPGAGTGAGPVPGQDIGKGPEAGEDDPAGQQ
jgi:probable rRNA maturation factor